MKATLAVMAGLATTIVAGCSTLPRDGPSGRAIEAGATKTSSPGAYAIVDLDYAGVELIKSHPEHFLASLADADAPTTAGLIGAGDGLAISIFEPSGTLFGSGTAGSSGIRSGTQSMPTIRVDSGGSINVPFAGPIAVAGLTESQAANAIRRALVGKVGSPQVVVSVTENAFNAVTVLGEVRQPGRAPITSNADRVLDVIAERGGTARPVDDVLVRIDRAGRTYDAPLSLVSTQASENVRLTSGDQVNLVFVPRRFSTFGALGAVAQIDMGAGHLSLSGALSKVGGLDTNSANARSVLVFRFERPEVAAAMGLNQASTARGVPVVYRLNLTEGEGFFTAENFEVRSGDMLYVPRSGSAELGKFFTLVQTVSRVVYDVSVTSSLNN